MKLFPIEDPVAGEQILSVQPKIERYPDAQWRQRLAYFTGRALTHTALRLEQQGRDGYLATLGRSVSPGVVMGLEATARSTSEGAEIEIAAGMGITASGEIVNVNRNRRVMLDDIRVYAPASILEFGYDVHLMSVETTDELVDVGRSLVIVALVGTALHIRVFDVSGERAVDRTESELFKGDALTRLKQRLVSFPDEPSPQDKHEIIRYAISSAGLTLGQLRAAGQTLTRVMALVLQPVAVEHYGDQPSTDPCDYDPTDEAFENWQWLDGCRLTLHVWDSAPGNLPVPGKWWRNRIAHALFDYERRLVEGEYPPWFSLGLPIALVGLDSSLELDFLDRNSVVRRGGEPKGRDVPITPGGNRFLWQAIFEQFNEHLVDWLMSDSNPDPAEIRAEDEFWHLPAVGILPKETVSPRQKLQRFFPVGYSVRALAIPYEQLDLAIEESASLFPYDLNTSDRVEVLVPVPQQYYEPRLLAVEKIEPEFEEAVIRFSEIRDQWLGRRLDVRAKTSALHQSIKGDPLVFPKDDPEAVDGTEQQLDFKKTLVASGEDWKFLKGDAAPAANWYQVDFDDSGWADDGRTPIGYGRDDLDTPLDDMSGTYVTLYLRHSFNLDELEEARRYTLIVTTQGGFHAYLNNRFLTSDNVTGRSHEAVADESRDAEPRRYELGDLRGLLRKGENLLAILAHNASKDAAAFEIGVELVDTEDGFGTIPKLFDYAAQAPAEPQYEVEELKELHSYLMAESSPLSSSEVDELDALGIEKFVDFLQRKIAKADDTIDFGFLRVRTDMYRVRQSILGNELGTKLATSPALAEIAKTESAAATKLELSAFYEHLKKVAGKKVTPTDTDGGNGDGESTAAGGSGRQTYFSWELTKSETEMLYRSTDMKDYQAPGYDTLATLGEGTLLWTGDQAIKTETAPKLALASTASSPKLYAGATYTTVTGQSAVIGSVQKFNNVTVGERLEEPSAYASLMEGVAVKGDVIRELLESDLNIDDLVVPGTTKEGETSNKSFAQIGADTGFLDELLVEQLYDVVDDVKDEAAYFNASVRTMENAIATLRLVEGRVHDYRRAVVRCKSVLGDVQADLKKADQRLKTIGDELAEARHDVSVARSLRAEEQARIDALNEKRDKVLETRVPFLLFRRPRTLDARSPAPSHYLNPDLSETPLPLCDLSEVEPPEALEAMLDVARDAPLKWFSVGEKLLTRLSRIADLQVTLSGAKKRATSKITVHPYLKNNFQVPDKLLRGIGATLARSNKRIQVERKKTALMDLSVFQRMGWKESIRPVAEVVSLGDLIDGNHGRMSASRKAADELAAIERVATCLYVGFSEVPASIRLHWVEQLSQFDEAVNLRNLYSLPRFSELDYIERQNMQRLVDWLYGRILTKYQDARDLISDLIRVGLLAASHAPANQLIAGHLAEPVTAKVGTRISLVADLSRIRIGMAFSTATMGSKVIRGRVVDLSGGQVSARVDKIADLVPGPAGDTKPAIQESVELDAGTRVQFGERLGMQIPF